MNIFEIFKPIMGFFGWQPVKTILMLPKPRKIVVKRIPYDDTYDREDMIFTKDPAKIVPEYTALTVHAAPGDCQMDLKDNSLWIGVAWTLVHAIVSLVWPWLMNRLMEKEKGNDVQACKDDTFYDCQSIGETEETKNISNDFQSEKDFQYDSTEVFPDFGSEKKEAIANLKSQEKNEVFPDFGSDKEEAIANLKSQEKNDVLGLESDEKNVFPDSPSHEVGVSNLPSEQEENLILKSKKGLLDIPTAEEMIPSLRPDEEKMICPLESKEKGLPDLPSDEKGFPKLPSDKAKMLPYLESKTENLPDLSFSVKKMASSVENEEKDLPSEEKGLPYLELAKQQSLFCSQLNEKKFPDLTSDHEELPELPSKKEEVKNEAFPDLISNGKKFSDLTSDEQEIYLYFKSKEMWFPDLPSDEEILPDLQSDKKAKLHLLEFEEQLLDLPYNQERLLDLPAKPEWFGGFPNLPSGKKQRLICLESNQKDFPVRSSTKNYSLMSSPTKRKASSTCSPTRSYSKR